MLKELRDIMGLSIEQVSDELQMSPQQVADLEEANDPGYADLLFSAFPLNRRVMTNPDADPFLRSYDQTSPGKRMESWMLENKISASRMAEQLGVKTEDILSFIKGEVSLNRARGEEIERRTGLNRKWLMYGDGRNKGRPVADLRKLAEPAPGENVSMLEKMAADFNSLPDQPVVVPEDEKQHKKALGQQIRNMRKELNLSLRQAGDIVHITESRMSQIECGVLTDKRADEVMALLENYKRKPGKVRLSRNPREDDYLILPVATGKVWGEKLHAARKDYRLSQQEVGDLMGVSRSAIGLMERGRVSKKTVDRLLKLMREKYGRRRKY